MKMNTTITRKLSLAALAGAVLFFGLVLTQKASAVSLKSHTVITGNMITLGDLFQGLPHGADKILGPAPQPGQEMTLNARTLMRVARALDIQWTPTSSAEYVVLSRAATVIDQDTIEQTLKTSLKSKGVTGKYNLILPVGRTQMILPPDQMGSVEVQSLNLKRQGKYFEATLVAPSRDNPIKTMRLSGSIETLVEIPVLRDSMRKGMVIGKRDVEIIDMPEHLLNHDMIMNIDNLIGTTPRRLITSRAPIKSSEVEAPQIVERGEFVTLLFARGTLKLTARGKALENGAKGDTIRIVNTGSNKTIEGIVTASKEVTVRTF